MAENRADRPRGLRALESPSHLPQDLVLAENHRVEPRGDLKEVARRVVIHEEVRMGLELGRWDIPALCQEVDKLFLKVGTSCDEVQLGTVACIQNVGLVASGCQRSKAERERLLSEG